MDTIQTKDLFIPLVLGTAREGRESEKVAQYVHGRMKAYGVQTEFIDVRDWQVPYTIAHWDEDERARPWRETMARADGLVIVSPEYNHGYPGELKLFLDQAYKQYHRKPVGLCGVSNGIFGGARMMEVLKISLLKMEMIPARMTVNFGNVEDIFDEQGTLKDSSFFDERTTAMLDEVTWYAKALRPARLAREQE